MFLFKPREKELTENQKKCQSSSWLSETMEQSASHPSWTEAGIWQGWEERTCKSTPTYEDPFPKAHKFKSVFSHHTFLSFISALIAAVQVTAHSGAHWDLPRHSSWVSLTVNPSLHSHL